MPKTLIPFILHFINQQRGLFILLTICHLAWALDNTLHSYIFKMFLDAIVNYTGDRAEAWTVLLKPVMLGVTLWLSIEVMFRTYDYTSSIVYPRFEASVRMAMVEYIQNHSHKYFADNFAGSIANKVGDIPRSAATILQLTTTLFIPALVAIILGSSIFFTMHPFFAFIMLIWFCLHMGVAFWYAKECSTRSEMHSNSRSNLTGKIVDGFSNIVAIKSFAMQAWELKNLALYQDDEKNKHQRVLRLTFKIRLFQAVLCFSLIGFTQTWLMIIYWQKGILSAGDLTYIFYTSWGLAIMAWISGIELPNFFKEVGTCNQALRLIQAEHEVVDSAGAKPIQISKGEIEFKDVTFRYSKNNNIFADKNVRIEAGSKIGLVGFSGSGKTTFVNLILRFFDIESGQILIDGQDIAKVTQESLRSQISMIPQDPSLFHRSLLENIRYGKISASDDEVKLAAKRANCDEFIMQLPEGYDTLVGERGIKLSGGQRQRIAIARAMLKDAPILILDEATSALDSVTEREIQDSLDELMKNRTTIVIAHRLSTLSEMDRILVFDKGHVIEDGSHKKLLRSKGHYARMWKMQAGGFLPEKDGE